MTDKDVIASWMNVLRADAPETAASTAVERLLAFLVADLPPEHAAHVTRGFADAARAVQDLDAGAVRPSITPRAWDNPKPSEGLIVGSLREDAGPEPGRDGPLASGRPRMAEGE